MTSGTLKRALGDSIMAMVSEHRRLDEALAEKERRQMATEITDDTIRALARDVAARQAKLDEARAVLAKAEQQRGVLARDKAAATEAAHREAVSQCQARIKSLLERQLRFIEHAEKLARELLSTREEIVRANAEARAEAKRLGRGDAVGSDTELIKRMSLRESKVMGELAGCTHRYGALVLASGSHGLVPDALTWSEDEARYQRDARALAEEVL